MFAELLRRILNGKSITEAREMIYLVSVNKKNKGVLIIRYECNQSL